MNPFNVIGIFDERNAFVEGSGLNVTHVLTRNQVIL
jgi:hypothetical protein